VLMMNKPKISEFGIQNSVLRNSACMVQSKEQSDTENPESKVRNLQYEMRRACYNFILMPQDKFNTFTH